MDKTPDNELLLAELDETLRQKLELSGHCAQASFAALDEHFALGGGAVVKALTPIPGIALRGETCGALTGPLMALGLAFGRERLDDHAGFREALPPAREFCRRFEAEFGSTRCDEILSSRLGRPFDLSRQADFAAYQACGGLESCTAVIRAAARQAATIILEQRPDTADPGVLLTA
ncbi:MAG: C-GCAxxG-C-C family protein [Candidatus Promineifilaceae bacterium]